MKELLITIAQGLVENPETVEVHVDEPTEDGTIVYHLHVGETDMGRVIGKQGRIAKAIRTVMRAAAVSYPEPDVTNCGGVTVFMKVAHLAESFNLPLTSHGAHDITVHLLAAAPNRSYLEAHGFGLDKYIANPLRIVEGNALAADRPGHGVEFDWAALEPLRVQ